MNDRRLLVNALTQLSERIRSVTNKQADRQNMSDDLLAVLRDKVPGAHQETTITDDGLQTALNFVKVAIFLHLGNYAWHQEIVHRLQMGVNREQISVDDINTLCAGIEKAAA